MGRTAATSVASHSC